MDVFLPLFPLQLVVYPGEPLNLHIFEPRYKQLIMECEQEGITFGIPAYIEGKVKEIGTEMELLRIEKKYSNGEMDIKTRGTGLFHIKNFQHLAPGRLYSGADVERLSYTTQGDLLSARRVLDLTRQLFDLLSIRKDLPGEPEELLTYDIAHQVGLNLEQEYELLCIREEIFRQQYLIDHLERLLPVVQEMENLRKKVQMNGHFRNIIPPEF